MMVGKWVRLRHFRQEPLLLYCTWYLHGGIIVGRA